MKVGYIAPASISAVNGGLRTQVNMTIEHVKRFGVEPIKISPWDHSIKWSQLDLIHVFGATVENSGIFPQISNLGVPLILSPVFYSNRNSNHIKVSIRIEKLLSAFGSGIRLDFGIKKDLCDLADLILPNTGREADLIQYGFGISPSKLNVIPNGVEERFSQAVKTPFVEKYGVEEFVLFVGQASAERKNVISLFRIAQKLRSKLVIIGSFNDSEYSKRCLDLASRSDNVLLIESLDHNSELLSSAYAAAKVFVLPSHYETPGISALEAGLAGTNIVITNVGGTREYFGEYGFYLDPSSDRSILDSINKALSQEVDQDLKVHILNNYTWEKVAEKTFDQYREMLK
jgi:glycosyltransferase involved in cell wall biosynthesis